ncbi:GlxA family transcriptional regulator [Amphritea japonica]|uniref:AraC family transcriptional regulator n=1 Tax=Amphritea japonica ATCC BAA-1530 TaxID=1278309 RepID=A0A7R6ST67_9GAMM|nr:GlxA family transcriptional regulator [Amphritea japonica]BBB27001.1 AraC family transcriptional regulator [Amphritea japonica ATCC BAA-1530]
MANIQKKRDFSSTMRSSNSQFLPSDHAPERPVKVGFVLLEHFSLMAFTAAVDTLVTANLVRTAPLFEHITLGVDSRKALSDLGIEIATNATLEHFAIEHRGSIDILIVCGGFRCELNQNSKLTETLKAADKLGLTLGGIWNGSIAIAHAGLLNDQPCAAHPDNHAFIREQFPLVQLADTALVMADKRASCAGPVSALQMMLTLVDQYYGEDTTRAIREILSCDQVAESGGKMKLQAGDNPTHPENLRSFMQLMNNNIEEPLTLEELAAHVGISRRQMERLFQTHLETSPSRYYLELRITHARRLLLQTNESITNVALASGFVSTSHFSNCYKDYFGVSPTAARAKK